MSSEENKEWGKRQRQSWEIESRLKQFREAIYEGERVICKEKWDPKRRKKMENALHKLIKQFSNFENVKWKMVDD